jgi:hypothetical protein
MVDVGPRAEGAGPVRVVVKITHLLGIEPDDVATPLRIPKWVLDLDVVTPPPRPLRVSQKLEVLLVSIEKGVFVGVLGKRLLNWSVDLVDLSFNSRGEGCRVVNLSLGGCLALQKLAPIMCDGGVTYLQPFCQSQMVRTQHLMAIETGGGRMKDLINHNLVSEVQVQQSNDFGIPIGKIIAIQKNLLIQLIRRKRIVGVGGNMSASAMRRNHLTLLGLLTVEFLSHNVELELILNCKDLRVLSFKLGN